MTVNPGLVHGAINRMWESPPLPLANDPSDSVSSIRPEEEISSLEVRDPIERYSADQNSQ